MLSEWEQWLYIEGMVQEGILTTSDETSPQPQGPPEIGKPIDMGPQNADLSRVGQRSVKLQTVNWGPPE